MTPRTNKAFFSACRTDGSDGAGDRGGVALSGALWIALDDVAAVIANLRPQEVEQNGESVTVDQAVQVVIRGAEDNILLVDDQARGFLVTWAAFTNDDGMVRAFEPFERSIVGDVEFERRKAKRDAQREERDRAKRLAFTAEEAEAIDQPIDGEAPPGLEFETAAEGAGQHFRMADSDRILERQNPALRVAFQALRLIDPNETGDLREIRIAARRTVALARQGVIS